MVELDISIDFMAHERRRWHGGGIKEEVESRTRWNQGRAECGGGA